MEAEISYDLVDEPNMVFVEGTFRLPGGEWQVFVFRRECVAVPVVRYELWREAQGVSVLFPIGEPLNYNVARMILGDALAISRWRVVHGPDSIQLR